MCQGRTLLSVKRKQDEIKTKNKKKYLKNKNGTLTLRYLKDKI